MDVQEKKAFEIAFDNKLGARGCQFDLDEDGNYEDRETLCGWHMWLEAKAQTDQKIKSLLCDEHLKKCESPTGIFNSQCSDEEPCLICLAKQAKAQTVPEGFVLVEKSKIRTWYQDDDEPENFCNSESDLNCLGDCLDDDDIIAVNIHESAHISTRKVFGVWKSNSPTDIQSNFVLVDSREKAEEIVASNKVMIEAQEQD